MKIGILTQPLGLNYGGIIQAYALQSVLKKLGHEAYTVDLPFRKTMYRSLKGFWGRIYHKFFLKNKNIDVFKHTPNSQELTLITQHTKKFINENIKLTEHIPRVEKLKRLKKYQFDAFIVGSDQVWRPVFSPGIPAFFLEFIKDNNKIKKIAYAASFGVDYWEYNSRLTKRCKMLAGKFNAISVREYSGVKLCQDYLSVKAQHLADPTLLLKREDYIDLIEKDNVTELKRTMMVYVLDITDEKTAIIDKVRMYLGLNINYGMPELKYSKESKKNIEKCILPPVTKWLRGFLDAEYVITDSFHGTVFSIIFNKPFLAIGNKNRGLGRFISLLKMFNLEHRLVSKIEEINIDLLNEKINFDDVNQRIQVEQQKALDFLKFHLSLREIRHD